MLISFLLCVTVLANIQGLRIDLPQGAQVEGVTHARGTNFFAADLISGNILLVDAKSGLLTTAVRPGANRTSLGMYATKNLLFVAGAGAVDVGILIGTGPGLPEPSLNVYDIATGDTVASCVVAQGVLVNDVVADGRFAYFTDSGRGIIYKLGVKDAARCEYETIVLPMGAFEPRIPPPFGVTANGVVMFEEGLIVANSMMSTIYFVDLANGNRVQQILPSGMLEGADGLEVVKRKNTSLLYVAQNSLHRVSVWRLQMSGRVVSARKVGFVSRREFDFPTTVAIAEKERLLMVPNTRLDEDLSGVGDKVLSLSVVRLYPGLAFLRVQS